MDHDSFYLEVQSILGSITNDIFDYEAAYAEAQAANASYQYYTYTNTMSEDDIDTFAAPVSLFGNNAAFTEEIVHQLKGTPNL